MLGFMLAAYFVFTVCVCPCIRYMLQTKIFILLAKWGQFNYKGLVEG